MASDAKSFGRRDVLRSIELDVQAAWAEAEPWNTDAPAVAAAAAGAAPAQSADGDDDGYLACFPYPYCNGVLHLGHAFTMMKAEFAARFQRQRGRRVLFPFGFHCTGMPIAACADKLKAEIAQFGCPPVFPAETEAAPAADSAADSAPKPKKKKKKKGKAAKKKSAKKYQWQIMQEMGVPEEEIPKFQDALYWLGYFPPIARTHLLEMGMSVDFRRSFITTSVNPYYDAFIRWQFNTLRKRDNKIAFGKRATVFSPATNQPCADHDRASGEGVNPQEYTLIKLRLVVAEDGSTAAKNDGLKQLIEVAAGRTIVLPAATLRPETMYGQTNCFVLPSGKYGIYDISDDEVFVASERSALNMAYQGITRLEREEGAKPLATIMGRDLLGCAVRAPLAAYEQVYILPLLTIKMNKGTGVVTSVPSDAPDDYAALMDMKRQEKERNKYGITLDMVEPFEVVPIIEIPGLGVSAAAKLCVEMKVKSQHDTKKLAEIKERVYTEGFYKGVMTVGEFAGMPVADAKVKTRDMMIERGDAVAYQEPESVVMSRSGDECVVTFCDQWYLDYGETSWRAPVEAHVRDKLETFNPVAKKKFEATVDWLRGWACSRSYGLGTQLPWDPQYVIESLSDSTIYMAYYTIAHFLQDGVTLDGSKPGISQVPAEQLTDAVFDYVFLHKETGGEYPADCGIPQETLDQWRAEFEYWYPVDLRVSGKDLIGNHLTMCLYNHAAIWPDQPETKWPRAFYTNGHIKLDNDKMSKSTGNFLTMHDSIEQYGADATRFCLASGGDSLQDANFDRSLANKIILTLTKEKDWIEEAIGKLDTFAADDAADRSVEMKTCDAMFENEMRRLTAEATDAFEGMQLREVLRAGFYDFMSARDNYRSAAAHAVPGGDEQDGTPPTLNRRLIELYIESFVKMLAPICPHLAQYLWADVLKRAEPRFVAFAAWPALGVSDALLSRKTRYLDTTATALQQLLNNPKKLRMPKGKRPANVTFWVATSLPDWKRVIVEAIERAFAEGSDLQPKDLRGIVQKECPGLKKKQVGKAMTFAATSLKEAQERGIDAISTDLPFDEVAFLGQNLAYVTRGTPCTEASVRSLDEDGAADAVGEDEMYVAQPGQPVIRIGFVDAE